MDTTTTTTGFELTADDITSLGHCVTEAILSGDPFCGANRRAMAATLRWAADRPETEPGAHLRLHSWADQLDDWAATATRHEHEGSVPESLLAAEYDACGPGVN